MRISGTIVRTFSGTNIHTAMRTHLKSTRGTGDRWLTLREAARVMGLSTRSLWRYCNKGLLPLKVEERNWRYHVRWSTLHTAPILTLGKAAKLCGVSYEKLRRWAKRGQLRCWRVRRHNDDAISRMLRGQGLDIPPVSTGYRRTSLREVQRALRRYRRKPVRLRLTVG